MKKRLNGGGEFEIEANGNSGEMEYCNGGNQASLQGVMKAE